MSGSIKPAKKKMSKMAFKENIWMLFMVAPAVLVVFIFHYLPMPGIVIAFKDFKPMKGIWKSKWVGFKNFEFFFTSSDAGRVIGNTVMYSIIFLILGLVTAIGLALTFYFLKSAIASKFYNTVVIIPRFMSMVIIAFIAYGMLSHSYGVINKIIEAFGGEGILWYMEAKYWPFILTFVHTWQSVGMKSVLYLASLMGMDGALLEAAKIDGANLRQQIWYVIIPHLIPIMVVNTTLEIGKLFSGDFGLFYQIPMDQGVLYPTTDIINTYTYRALMGGDLAKSAAVGLFQSVVGCILVIVTNAIVRKISPDDSLF